MPAAAETYFVDTNVLLYALDANDPVKQARAAAWLHRLWEHGAGRLSWQVLHEFYANASGKLRLDPKLARSTVSAFSHWQPLDSSLALLQRAWYWLDRARLNYWDALIVAAAEVTESRYLLSEDFQSGQRFGNCEIVNPFAATSDPASFRR